METKTRAARKKKTRQFIVDEKDRRVAVVLPIEEYERLLEAAEDLEDIRAADEARAEGGEPVPLEEVEARLRAEGKLR
jgi:PHD/YefM family antitoxin component YafN of YafNO toxin-antitoxin module